MIRLIADMQRDYPDAYRQWADAMRERGRRPLTGKAVSEETERLFATAQQCITRGESPHAVFYLLEQRAARLTVRPNQDRIDDVNRFLPDDQPIERIWNRVYGDDQP